MKISPHHLMRCFLDHIEKCHPQMDPEAQRRRAHQLSRELLDLSPLAWVCAMSTPLLLSKTEQKAMELFLDHPFPGTTPSARLWGWTRFCGHLFFVSPFTLDPRWESEQIIEESDQCLKKASFLKNHSLSLKDEGGKPLHVLDLGTGTGCLLLSLLMLYPQAWGWGVDVCPRALETARRNGEALQISRVTWVEGSWWQAFEGLTPSFPSDLSKSLFKNQDHFLGQSPSSFKHFFHLIVSNPPYIPEQEQLPSEVIDWDPKIALFAGKDGLHAYRLLAEKLVYYLAPGAPFVMEIGHGQGEAVGKIFSDAGLKEVTIKKDADEKERVVLGWAPEVAESPSLNPCLESLSSNPRP